MSDFFRNIDPPPLHRPASVYPPAFGAGGGHARWVERGWGVSSSEDARHCSVIYICKCFVEAGFYPELSCPDIHFIQYLYYEEITPRNWGMRCLL